MREFLTTGVGICALEFTLVGFAYTSIALALALTQDLTKTVPTF